jgi:hypothetical protein
MVKSYKEALEFIRKQLEAKLAKEQEENAAKTGNQQEDRVGEHSGADASGVSAETSGSNRTE